MDDETLNKWLHENVMDGRRHDILLYRQGIANHRDDEYACSKCLQRQFHNNWTHPCEALPENYCQSLDAVSRVERKVIETVGLETYGVSLSKIIAYSLPISWRGIGHHATAAARQRAEACKIAWEANK